MVEGVLDMEIWACAWLMIHILTTIVGEDLNYPLHSQLPSMEPVPLFGGLAIFGRGFKELAYENLTVWRTYDQYS